MCTCSYIMSNACESYVINFSDTTGRETGNPNWLITDHQVTHYYTAHKNQAVMFQNLTKRPGFKLNYSKDGRNSNRQAM